MMSGMRWLGGCHDRLLQMPSFAVEKRMSFVSLEGHTERVFVMPVHKDGIVAVQCVRPWERGQLARIAG